MEFEAFEMVMYADLTWKEFEETKPRIAVLPMGSIEQHGFHLPLGNDSYVADGIMKRVSEKMGRRVLILPTLFYGCSTATKGFPGGISLRPETVTMVLMDICKELARNG